MGKVSSHDELRKHPERRKHQKPGPQGEISTVQNKLSKLQFFCDLTAILNTGNKLNTKLQFVVDNIREQLNVDIALIALGDGNAAVFQVTHVSGDRSDHLHTLCFPSDKGLCSSGSDQKRSVILEDCTDIDSHSPPEVKSAISAEGIVTGASMPLHMNSHRLGVLGVFNRAQRVFRATDLDFLALIGNLVEAEVSRWQTEELLSATLGELERLVDDRSRELLDTNIQLEQEIEERKQVEAHFREREALLRIFVEHTPAAVAMCDLDMHYLAHSQRWVTDYHLGEENLIGRSHYEVFQTIPEHWKAQHQRCFRGEVIETEEEPFRRADGSVDWVRRKVHPWRRTDGAIGGLIMFTEVITQRKEAELALQASEVKYRLLFENASDAIFIAQEGNVTFPSPKVSELFGYSMAELDQLPLDRLLHPEDRERVMAHQHKRLTKAKSKPDQYSCRFITREGSELLMALSSVKITWEGRPATLNFARDITEQKQLELQLQQAQRMEAIGTLAGGIAHDFNNLLMGIQGRASLMLLELDPSHPHFEHLKGIEKYVQNATDLSKQLLGFARGGRYEVKSTDLNALAERSVDLFGRTRKEIRIHRTFHSDLWAAEVDRSQIEQVLLNILVNAWQAMPGGGDLYVETSNVTLSPPSTEAMASGHFICISIRDTGVGMDAATRARIFEPFFTTKEMGRGTGLGLASAYGIVKGHGGMITVSSEKGVGSTFSIYLPASPEDVVEPMMRRAGNMETGNETLLLVDDEIFVLEVGKEMLSRLGYHVMVASNGSEAIEVYRTYGNVIDCVVLDMIMPDMSGGDVYDRLIAMNPNVKVLLSSGYSLNGKASEILERGCNGFIQKPFDIQQLSGKIRKVLDDSP